jgi:tRNA/tmRNA/rRNA uracil-C5-methylase (TrmA/RlmC/RlmD family)
MLVDAVFGGLNLGRGDKVLDLYCGVGLFTVPAAIAVGEAGRVVGIESATSACDDLMENAKDMTWVIVHEGRVNAHNVSRFGATMNVVIVDPPRRGIEPGVVEAIGAIETIREVVSVSCDIATFVRDLELFLAHGFHLRALRAFDLFEMTEHVEMVAHLER